MGEKDVRARGIWHSYALEGVEPGARGADGRVPRDAADLCDVTFDVEAGSLVAVVGENGGGKTTLARHLNALLDLQEGFLEVVGVDASDADAVWELRRRCGMVFQNPENQFVSSVVGEDVAFGPQNFGATPEAAQRAAAWALSAVGLSGFGRRDVHELSGGQQQRVALAGALASEPSVIVLDEATSMLDASSRAEVMETVAHVREVRGATVIMLTHDMELAARADWVIVMRAGRVVAQGVPAEVLADEALLVGAGLEMPFAARVWRALERTGAVDAGQPCPVTAEGLVSLLCG